MTEAEREKIKLRAAYLNGLALIFFGLGGLGPAFALLDSAFQGTIEWVVVGSALVWLWAGAMSSWELHKMAERRLNLLSEPQ